MLKNTKNAGIKRVLSVLLTLLLVVQFVPAGIFTAVAASGTPISALSSIEKDMEFMGENPNTQAYLIKTISGEKLRVIFYKNDMFRIWMANSGTGEFEVQDSSDLPVSQQWDLGGITSMDDLDIVVKHDFGVMPEVTMSDNTSYIELTTPIITVRVYKNPLLFEMLDAQGKILWSEAQPIHRGSTTTQVLKTDDLEHFFGGGMQVGYFSHKGRMVNISRSGWTVGTAPSPVPFYMSSKGYGVFRNTYKNGTYNFRSNTMVETAHSENRFDAYYFLGDFEAVLDGYTELTGRPTMIPKWALGLGDASAYRQLLDTSEEGGNPPNAGTQRPAQSPYGGFWHEEGTTGVLKDFQSWYADMDMPVSWFLPNDGYGCEYNKATHPGGSLGATSEGLMENGIRTGLWVGQPQNYTDRNYTYGFPDEIVRKADGSIKSASELTEAERQTLKPFFQKEITAQVKDWGVRVYKIDVAWSSQKGLKGDMGIFNQMSNNIEQNTGERGMLVTVYGWAGGQRYTTLWSGDQSGTDDYIQYHIPTITGSGMSGYPYATSDQAAIYNHNPGVYVRDLQMKLLVPTNIAMSNWGNGTTFENAEPEKGGSSRATSDKRPGSVYQNTAEEIEINRKYMKLKVQLVPYIYSYARKAHDKGSPIVRPLVYNYPEDSFTYDDKTQYQYMSGDWFLVAPVYDPNAVVREDIYLPEGRWVDYWSGQEYFGPTIINVDAPYDTLPMFVRGGAIVPMAQEHLYDGQEYYNGKKVDDTIIFDVYPEGVTSFDLYEDDGYTVKYKDGEYAFTTITSNAPEAGILGDLTINIGPSVGEYEGKLSERMNLLMVHTSIKPDFVRLGGKDGVDLAPYTSYEAVNNAENGAWFFDPEDKGGMLYIKTPAMSTSSETTVWVDSYMANKAPEKELSLPLAENVKAAGVSYDSISVTWDDVAGATGYDIQINGLTIIENVSSGYVHSGLYPETRYTYSIRAKNADSVSGWTPAVAGETLDDPYRFELDKYGMSASFTQTNPTTGVTSSLSTYSTEYSSLAIDGLIESQWHSGQNSSSNNYCNLDVNLGGLYLIDKFEYMPRPEKSNGTINNYAILTSLDGVTYKEVATGTWSWSGESGQYTSRTVTFDPTFARYVRLQRRTGVSRHISGREIWVFATEKNVLFNSLAEGASADASSVWENNGSELEKVSDLTAYTIDGESESGGGYMPDLAVNGNTTDPRGWRTAKAVDLPVTLNIGWSGTQTVSAFKYYPLPPDAQQREGSDGDITEYALYAVTTTGVQWLAGGTWEADGQPKVINFPPIAASGLQFVVVDAVGGFGAASEVEVYKQVADTAGTVETYPEPSYAAKYAVDDRTDTGWAAKEGNEATLVVDLGKEMSFDFIKILFGQRTRDRGTAYDLEYSNDGENWQLITSVTGNSVVEPIYQVDITARYVRYVGKASGGAHLIRSFDVLANDKVERIELESGAIEVEVTDEITLDAQIYPKTARDQTLTWTSSDASVFTVHATRGKITAVSPGEATLTVASAVDSSVFATCKVTVMPVDVDSIILNAGAELALPVNGSYQLLATILPYKAAGNNVTWTSADTQTVTVSHNGFITGLKLGEAVVTAESQGKSASVKVIVTDIADVSLDNTAGTFTVKFGALPENVLQRYFVATYNDGSGDKPLDLFNMMLDRENSAVTFTYVPFPPNSREKVDVSVYYKNGQVKTAVVTVAHGYKVIFDGQGAEAAANPSEITVTGGQTTVGTLPADPARNGYTFEGWFTEPEGKGSQFFADTTVTSDITVYAKWKGVPRTVSFESNGGTEIENIVVENGKTFAAPEAPAKDNYRFMGWYSDEGLEKAWNFETDVVLGDITLYAKWTLICTVTFEVNGGNPVSPLELLYGDKVPEPAVSKDGYAFLGWYADEGFKTLWNFATDTVSGDITLYARWVGVGASVITFNTMGGSEIAQATVENGTPIGQVDIPQRGGDVFAGWYTDEACTKAWNLLTDLVYEDMTLYAAYISPLFHYGFESASELDVTGQPYAVIAKTSSANVSEDTGVKGGSLYLPGNNGYVRVDANRFDYENQNFTISMWINPESVSRQQFLFTSATGDDWFLLRSGGYLGSYYMGSGNDTYSHTPIKANEWTYLTVTRASNEVRYYINGEYVARSSAASWLAGPGSFFSFGGKSNSTTSTGCFTGHMDEISFFNAVLTPDQVVQLYNRDRAPVVTITENPAPTTMLLEGETANLYVAATVDAELELAYQWYAAEEVSDFNGVPVEGATGDTFAIPSDLAHGNYYYYCVVSASGAKPAVSSMATVSVMEVDIVVKVSANVTKLVATYAANIPVEVIVPEKYAGLDVYVALYDAEGQELVTALTVDGKAVIKVTDQIKDSGSNEIYTVRAYAEGREPSHNVAEIEIVSIASVSLWKALAVTSVEDEKIVVTSLQFGAKVGLHDKAVIKLVNADGERAIPKNEVTLNGSSIILNNPVDAEGKIVVSGFMYPELFPSYMFTFTVNLG